MSTPTNKIAEIVTAIRSSTKVNPRERGAVVLLFIKKKNAFANYMLITFFCKSILGMIHCDRIYKYGIMQFMEQYQDRPEILPVFQGFEEYISANIETAISEREKLAALASGCNYEDACFLRDWLFDNRSQYSGTGRLRTFEAYAIFRGVADNHRTQALFDMIQTA
jgi:hypothetical protein